MFTEYITLVESLYLLFMYFIYKTKYTYGQAPYDKETQRLGPMFVHDTGQYENKVCLFGKIMSLIAVMLAAARLYFIVYRDSSSSSSSSSNNTHILFITTLLFDTICIFLAYIMNFTAFIYLIPLLVPESYFLYLLSRTAKSEKPDKSEKLKGDQWDLNPFNN